MPNDTAILRNVQNDCIYRHIEGDRYKNLTTGAEGEIPPEVAQKVLKINLDATGLMNKYPLLEIFIERLELKGEII